MSRCTTSIHPGKRMLHPNKRLAVAVGASLLAATLIMFWTLHRALSNIQAFA